MEINQNGNEMENFRPKHNVKLNGNGMELNTTNQVEEKFNGMEWKRNGNGMESKCK